MHSFLSQDDRYFISGALDGKLRLWSIPDKRVVLWNEVGGQPNLITAANFCQVGSLKIIWEHQYGVIRCQIGNYVYVLKLADLWIGLLFKFSNMSFPTSRTGSLQSLGHTMAGASFMKQSSSSTSPRSTWGLPEGRMPRDGRLRASNQYPGRTR